MNRRNKQIPKPKPRILAKRNQQNKQIQANKNPMGRAAIANQNLGSLVNQSKPTSAIIRPQNAMREYLHTLINDDYTSVARKPLNDMGRTYVKHVKYRIAKTVSSSGRLFVTLPASLLASLGNGSVVSPFVICNDNNYDPSSKSNAITGTGNYDLNIAGSSGTDINADHFWTSTLENFHVGVTFSGVSNLNKKGKLYVAEARMANWGLGHGTTTDLVNTQMNRLSLSDLIKLNHYKELEIMNMTTADTIEYHYIPEGGYGDEIKQKPIDKSSATNDSVDRKGFVLVVDGADPLTSIILDLTIGLRLRPLTTYYNTYPSAYTNCFINPDPALRYLEQRTDMVLQCGPKHMHRAFNSNSLGALDTLINQYDKRKWEFHLPGHNYAGPGTQVLFRISRGDFPTTGLDAASLIHDTEYYMSDNDTLADKNMITNLRNYYSPYNPIPLMVDGSLKLKSLYTNLSTPDVDIYNNLRTSIAEKSLLKDYKQMHFQDDIKSSYRL